MSDITIKEFSKTVGLSVNRLIDQLELAGVKNKNEKDLISDEEKMQLLNYVRNSNVKKKSTASPQKNENEITQKNKTNTVIRKKRVFSKVNNQVTEKVESKSNNNDLKKESLPELDLAKEDQNNETENIETSSSNIDVTSNMIEIKSELEKIREQNQNIL